MHQVFRLETIPFGESYDITSIPESWVDITIRHFSADYAIPGYISFNSDKGNEVRGVGLSYRQS